MVGLSQPAAARQEALDAAVKPREKRRDVGVGGRGQAVEDGPGGRGRARVDTVEDERVDVHVGGSYSRLGQAFEQVFRGWVVTSRVKLREAPCLEVYLNDPKTTCEEDLLTEFWVPIE
jgi:hypothetical protein